MYTEIGFPDQLGDAVNGLGHFLELALAVLALTAIAGVGSLRTIVADLRGQLNDAREERETKDRRHAEEMADLTERLTAAELEIVRQRAKINSQEHDLEAVGRLVRGESYWLELGDKLDEHHTEALVHWETHTAKLDRIIEILEA